MRQARSACAAVLLLAAARALAQQPQPELRWLAARDLTAQLELRYESDDRQRQEKNSSLTTQFTNTRFHEIFTLGMRGYVYHPRFLDFSARLGFDIQQTDVSVSAPGESRTDSSNSVSPQYSISGTFLPQHPVSLSFALDKYRSVTAQAYGSLTLNDTESQHVSLNVKSEEFPAEVHFGRRKATMEQQGYGENRDTEELNAGFVLHHYAPRSTSQLSYEYLDSTENVTSFDNFFAPYFTKRKTHDASVSNHLLFGKGNEDFLDSRLGLRDETGSFPSSRLSLDEALHLSHTRSLKSDYSLRISHDTVADTTIDVVSGRAALSHQLFESLFTNLEIHGSDERFDGSSRDIYGTALSVDYRKRIPHGTFLLSLGGGYEITREQGQSSVRPVVDESHVLSDATIVFLNNPNVILSTVRVTDTTGATTYVLDLHYRLIQHGAYVEIRRKVSLPDGTGVLVDYSYETGGPFDYATTEWRARAQVDLFEHVTLYAGTRSTTQDLLAGLDEGRLQNVTDRIFGTILRWGPATLSAEHEIYDSTQAPYTSDSVSLGLQRTFADLHNLTGLISFRHVTFGAGDQSTLRTVSGTYRLTPRVGPLLSLTAGYEQENDRGFAGTYAFARVEATWRIRATEFSGGYWINRRDDDFALDRSSYIFLSVRRKF